jgi:glutaredoxin
MNFIVYSKPGCPYCTKIKEVLKLKNFSYQEKILDEDFNRNDFYAQFGVGSTFPQVIMNDEKLGGCTDTVRYLRESNLI